MRRLHSERYMDELIDLDAAFKANRLTQREFIQHRNDLIGLAHGSVESRRSLAHTLADLHLHCKSKDKIDACARALAQHFTEAKRSLKAILASIPNAVIEDGFTFNDIFGLSISQSQ